jgi:hypothetical protein
MKRVSRHISTLTNHFLVQCNTKDHRNLAFSRRAEPKFFRALLQESGFPLIDVDHPWEKPLKWIWPRRYFRPVVVGRKR